MAFRPQKKKKKRMAFPVGRKTGMMLVRTQEARAAVEEGACRPPRSAFSSRVVSQNSSGVAFDQAP